MIFFTDYCSLSMDLHESETLGSNIIREAPILSWVLSSGTLSGSQDEDPEKGPLLTFTRGGKGNYCEIYLECSTTMVYSLGEKILQSPVLVWGERPTYSSLL